jgi:hypothetical protein
MKTYKNETVATKLCDAANAKTPGHTVVAVEGGFQVHPAGYVAPAEAPKAPKAPEVTTVTAQVQKKEEAAPVAPVSMHFAGAKAKPVYVITQPCGKNNKERWFKRDRLISVVEENGGVTITALPKEFTSRGL